MYDNESNDMHDMYDNDMYDKEIPINSLQTDSLAP